MTLMSCSKHKPAVFFMKWLNRSFLVTLSDVLCSETSLIIFLMKSVTDGGINLKTAQSFKKVKNVIYKDVKTVDLTQINV